MTVNYLTVDIEDYFQVSAFAGVISRDEWEKFTPRVVDNTRKVLELFAGHQVQATFFILGWVAEKFPFLVREIAAAGHEIACHGYSHRLVYELSLEEFREDTERAKKLLEDVSGRPVLGYRAPSYSITGKSLWALEVLEELGFAYDSSIFPIHHDRYGIPGAPRFPYRLPGLNMVEYPLSTSLFLGRKIPVAGGGYFRLFPYQFTSWALNRINQREGKPFIFYFHPWEIDPAQPRMRNISPLSRFRHYLNLSRTRERLERLLTDFSFQPVSG